MKAKKLDVVRGSGNVFRDVGHKDADRSQTGEKVVVQLTQLAAMRGVPESITTDNGSEFAGRAMEAWSYRNGVKLDLIRPGRPVENGYIESFNGVPTALWMIGHLRSLPASWGSGPSPSPSSLRQARNPVEGPLPPGYRPPLTGPRSCLLNLR